MLITQVVARIEGNMQKLKESIERDRKDQWEIINGLTKEIKEIKDAIKAIKK